MAQATRKERETKAVATRRPAEILPRGSDFERWVDRFFEDFWRRPFPSLWRPERWWPFETDVLRMPAVDVYEDKDDVVLKAELPGLSKEDINVQVSDSSVTIKGEKKREEEVKEQDYYRCERSYGTFARTIELPCQVKADQVQASYKNGVLEIRLPKTEEAKTKTITVKID